MDLTTKRELFKDVGRDSARFERRHKNLIHFSLIGLIALSLMGEWTLRVHGVSFKVADWTFVALAVICELA